MAEQFEQDDREVLVKAALRVLHPNATRNMPMALDYSHKIANAVIAAGFRRTPAPQQVDKVALVAEVAEALSKRAEWPSLHWPDVSCMQHADVAKAFAETVVQVVSAVLYRPEGGESK